LFSDACTINNGFTVNLLRVLSSRDDFDATGIIFLCNLVARYAIPIAIALLAIAFLVKPRKDNH